MNTRKTRTMLWLGTACLFGAALTVVGYHVVFPVHVEMVDRSSPESEPADLASQGTPVQSIDATSLKRVAGKNIRQQLFDPPVVAPTPPPPKPLPPIELISTILGGNGQHRAWVRDGQTLRKIVAGDMLGPAENPALVESIEVDRLLLKHEGKQIEVGQQATSGGRR